MILGCQNCPNDEMTFEEFAEMMDSMEDKDVSRALHFFAKYIQLKEIQIQLMCVGFDKNMAKKLSYNFLGQDKLLKCFCRVVAIVGKDNLFGD